MLFFIKFYTSGVYFKIDVNNFKSDIFRQNKFKFSDKIYVEGVKHLYFLLKARVPRAVSGD